VPKAPVQLNLTQASPSLSEEDLQNTKVHLTIDVDLLSTSDITAFIRQHQATEPERIEWINDTSLNLVYGSAELASAALYTLTNDAIRDEVTVTPTTLRTAKSSTTHPTAGLQTRIAFKTDVKKRGARHESKWHLMHGEDEPTERGRQTNNRRGRRYDERPQYDDGDRPKRRRDDIDNKKWTENMYDDPPASVAPRGDEDLSDGEIDEDSQPARKRARSGDLMESYTRASGRLRDNRSASPSRDGDGRFGFRQRSRSPRTRRSARPRSRDIHRSERLPHYAPYIGPVLPACSHEVPWHPYTPPLRPGERVPPGFLPFPFEAAPVIHLYVPHANGGWVFVPDTKIGAVNDLLADRPTARRDNLLDTTPASNNDLFSRVLPLTNNQERLHRLSPPSNARHDQPPIELLPHKLSATQDSSPRELFPPRKGSRGHQRNHALDTNDNTAADLFADRMDTAIESRNAGPTIASDDLFASNAKASKASKATKAEAARKFDLFPNRAQDKRTAKPDLILNYKPASNASKPDLILGHKATSSVAKPDLILDYKPAASSRRVAGLGTSAPSTAGMSIKGMAGGPGFSILGAANAGNAGKELMSIKGRGGARMRAVDSMEY